MLRAVLFDMDGVLADSYQAWHLVLNDALQRHGQEPLTPAAFDAAWGQGIDRDRATWFPDLSIPELTGLYGELFPVHAHAVTAMPGALALLPALASRGLRLACVTNTPGDLARRILARLELAPHLAVVLGGDEATPKPAPDLLHRALERLEVHTSEALFVGDTHNDVAAAQAAGVRLVGFRQSMGIPVRELAEILSVADGF